MTEKSWILLLIVLTIVSLALSAVVIFTGGYNSYILRMISRYESPDAQIKVLQKQYAIEKLQIPEDKLKEIENVVSERYHIVVKDLNLSEVGVNNPFQGK